MPAEIFWAVGRGTGVVSLVLLTLSLLLGVIASTGLPVLHIERFVWQSVHRAAALTASGLIAVHVVSLLADPYAALRWSDVVVPFRATANPVWVGFGTVAVDVLIAVVLTGLMRRAVGPRVFRVVHLSTYVLWPIALTHALGAGSDFASTKSVLIGLTAGAGVCLAMGGLLTLRHRRRQLTEGFRPVHTPFTAMRKK